MRISTFGKIRWLTANVFQNERYHVVVNSVVFVLKFLNSKISSPVLTANLINRAVDGLLQRGQVK